MNLFLTGRILTDSSGAIYAEHYAIGGATPSPCSDAPACYPIAVMFTVGPAVAIIVAVVVTLSCS